MRMARVNITLPDELLTLARAAGINISAAAAAGLERELELELELREKNAALDRYLADLETEHGPITEEEIAAADAWLDQAIVVHPRRRAGTA